MDTVEVAAIYAQLYKNEVMTFIEHLSCLYYHDTTININYKSENPFPFTLLLIQYNMILMYTPTVK